jgi:hypothetical protein
VDANGRRVRLAGVNWYGFHEDDGMVPGLDRIDRRTLARSIALLGFNSVRLPFSLWMTEQVTPVPGEYLAANPDLIGSTPMQIYDACVEALTETGLVVIPNCHTLDPGWCPIPDTTQILTRSGWKYWYEVNAGDQTLGRASSGELQWTSIQQVVSWGPQPVIKMGNVGWSTVCTENHRWLMRSRRNRYVKGSGSKNKLQAGPYWNEPGEYQLQLTGYAEGGTNGCTPEQAAIIAWVLADGSCVYSGRGGMHLQACIYQKKEPQLSQIRDLLKHEEAYSSEAVDVRNGVTKLRLKKSYFAPLWDYFQISEKPTTFVLGLSREARRAWLDAWFAAEGWPSSNSGTRYIAQDRGPAFDAIVLSVFLEGYMPGIAQRPKGSFSGSKGNNFTISFRTKTIGNTRNCKPVYEAAGTAPVWCPTTGLGTFVARDGEGHIFLTGNCSADDGNGMWFNDRWSAERFFAAWRGLAARYQSNPLVAAMDIANEPRRTRATWRVLTPTWGSGSRTDIAAMYTTVGNLIHEVSPDVLIICEGLDYAADLTGVTRHPVRLDRPGKVVYSLHDYSWFHPENQPRAAYLEQMERTGGYLLTQQLAPVWVGECGTDTRSMAGFSGVWWNNFEAWVTDRDVDWCWWPLNPTQPRGTVPGTGRHRSHWGDPEPWGLLAPDWRGLANPAALEILKAMIAPRTGPGT